MKQISEKRKKTYNPQDLLITSEFKQEYIKELFRSLRTKILLGLYDALDKSLVITSLDAGSGKSTMSANIALAIALQNKRTVLLDGDLRRGTLSQIFNIDQAPGLSEFLQSAGEISEHTVSALLRPTHVTHLQVIPCGSHVMHSSELLTSERFVKLKKILSDKFDIILLDAPPLGAVTDAVVINEFFSKYLIIVKAGVTNVVHLKKKIKEFPVLEKKVMGLVLNYATIDTMRSYYKYSKYY